MANSYLDKNGLLYLWQKITGKFVAKETGKGLSTNDYTTTEKDKLGALPGIKQIGSGLELSEQGTLSATGGGTADAVNWANVQDKPTTLEGYGITDAAKATDLPKPSSTSPKMAGTAAVGTETTFARGDHVHPSDTTKANAAEVYKKTETYSKTEIDGKGYLTEHQDISGKADKATTLAGYGIEDAYTKTELDGKLSSVYKPGGNMLFANLPEPSAANLGLVYSMNDAFTTDDRFIASQPTSYPVGTNVVCVQVMAEDTPTYLYDVLAGFVDLSGYWKKTDLVAITNQEIDEIVGAA